MEIFKKLKNNQRGSITVFVLATMLIVVGIIVTIYMTTINKNNTQIAQLNKIQEEYMQTTDNSAMDQAYDENVEFGPGMIAEKNEEYEDDDGDTATIPKDFEIVPGLDDVSEGLVIRDSEGNEFVWIPVAQGEYQRNTEYADTNISESAYTDTGYLPEGIQPANDNPTDNENAERNAVTSKGGFYISRYEAGKEGTDTLVSKSGATVWTGISQKDCKAKAKSFINNDNVKSALCSGIQWDMTMAFVNGKEDGSAYGDKTYNVEQYKQNRHIGSTPSTSGQNPADRVCNIFDLEGNCYEYVAEKNSYYDKYYDTRMQIVSRGGFYSDTYPASCRNGYDGRGYGSHSFRFVLYVM